MKANVSAALAGERLDRVVSLVASITRAEASSCIDDGRVLLNGLVVRHRSRRVRDGDVVDVDVPERLAGAGLDPDSDVPFDVVYVDEAMIIVNKPAGVVVHPGAGNTSGTLVHGLIARYPDLAEIEPPAGGGRDRSVALRPGIVHRLDKGTSGLLVIGRTAEAVRALQAQLSDRSMRRRYVALALGHFTSRRGLIDAPIGRSEHEPTKMAVVAAGRAARTNYVVQEIFDQPEPTSLVNCSLETGRTHQIRVHLNAIGHPVVGDDRYGGARSSLILPRPFLHAAGLRLTHPRTGEPCEFEAPLPPDLAAVLARLRSQPESSKA